MLIKTMKICQNQHAELQRFLIAEDSLKIKGTWN